LIKVATKNVGIKSTVFETSILFTFPENCTSGKISSPLYVTFDIDFQEKMLMNIIGPKGTHCHKTLDSLFCLFRRIKLFLIDLNGIWFSREGINFGASHHNIKKKSTHIVKDFENLF